MGWDPIKDAKKKAERIATDIINKTLKPAERGIRDGVNKLGDETRSGVRKAGRDMENGFKKVGGEIESGLKKTGGEIEGGIKKVGDDIEDSAKVVGRELEGGLRTAAEEIEKTFEERIPELAEEAVEKAVDALADAITKEGLKKIKAIVQGINEEFTRLGKSKPSLVDALNVPGFDLEIGPLTLTYVKFYTRIDNVSDVLDTYINNPPEFRREPILKMVEALGPTTVALGASVQFMALVVGSKQLGFGGKLRDTPMSLFLEVSDAILEKIGVPE